MLGIYLKKNNITILNYGSGNLLSVKRAFEYCGAEVKISNNKTDIIFAERLVIPGVGAFNTGIEAIKENHLLEPLLQFYNSKRPLMGICLGMQLLSTKSFEFGINKGLNFIPGKVVKIETKSIHDDELKIPHIGWTQIDFTGLEMSDFYYMAHSYQFIPDDIKNISSFCSYGGHKIVTSIQLENIVGYQFHPEKSGNQGLKLLDSFLKI
jgi:imidazole glycerol-phosphate synthase subunit HisH